MHSLYNFYTHQISSSAQWPNVFSVRDEVGFKRIQDTHHAFQAPVSGVGSDAPTKMFLSPPPTNKQELYGTLLRVKVT